MSDEKVLSRPTVEELEAELKRLKAARKKRKMLIVAVAAALVVVAALYFFAVRSPSARAGGAGMAPVTEEGDVIFIRKAEETSRGDIIASGFGNMAFIGRVAALPGELVEMDGTGPFYKGFLTGARS